MAQKRIASTTLNHDNWNDEYVREESGRFQEAPQAELTSRPMKSATRHRSTFFPEFSQPDGTDSKCQVPSVFNKLGDLLTPAVKNNSRSFFMAKTETGKTPPISSFQEANDFKRKEFAKPHAGDEAVVRADGIPSKNKIQKINETALETNGIALKGSLSATESVLTSIKHVPADKFPLNKVNNLSTAGANTMVKNTFDPLRPTESSDINPRVIKGSEGLMSGTGYVKSPAMSSGIGYKPLPLHLAGQKSVISEVAKFAPGTVSQYDKASSTAATVSVTHSAIFSSGQDCKSALTPYAIPTGGAPADVRHTMSLAHKSLSDTNQSEQKEHSGFSYMMRCMDTGADHPSVENMSAATSLATQPPRLNDSRRLLKPVPDDIMQRIRAKSIADGKSEHFLKRTYQLNATTLEWLAMQVNDNLTVNLADVIPSYIEELLELVKEEQKSQSEEIRADLAPAQVFLSNMLNSFKQCDSGCEGKTKEPVDCIVEKLTSHVAVCAGDVETTKDTSSLIAPSQLHSEMKSCPQSQPHSGLSSVDEVENGPSDVVNSQESESEDQPPKPTFTPVVEDGSVCTMRCKVYVKKCDPKDPFDTAYQERGVGNLFIKPISKGKAQLVVRADNSLGNILLNVCITAEIPIEMANANTVMMVCRPLLNDVSPRTVLIRVKTEEDAELLLEKLIII